MCVTSRRPTRASSSSATYRRRGSIRDDNGVSVRARCRIGYCCRRTGSYETHIYVPRRAMTQKPRRRGTTSFTGGFFPGRPERIRFGFSSRAVPCTIPHRVRAKKRQVRAAHCVRSPYTSFRDGKGHVYVRRRDRGARPPEEGN